MNAKELCLKAVELVAGDRAATHGPKLLNHTNIAKLWNAYLGTILSPRDVAIMMVLLKVARTKTGRHNPDDYLDMIGYASIAGELAEPQEAEPPDMEILLKGRIE